MPTISFEIDSGLMEFNIYQGMYHVVQLALQESTQFIEDCTREELLSQAIQDDDDGDDDDGTDDTNNETIKPTFNASSSYIEEDRTRPTFYEKQTFDDLRNGSFEYILVEGKFSLNHDHNNIVN